ncbi:hypothetical protein [Marilutibacter chinensis]|uniref:hypothetical protein n=1 Tax=Marilutibacter chinensis TaxID=2912247 RepID=UPI001F2D3315|nr:hypothetical protein [Lysobacter chinensis]
MSGIVANALAPGCASSTTAVRVSEVSYPFLRGDRSGLCRVSRVIDAATGANLVTGRRISISANTAL